MKNDYIAIFCRFLPDFALFFNLISIFFAFCKGLWADKMILLLRDLLQFCRILFDNLSCGFFIFLLESTKADIAAVAAQHSPVARKLSSEIFFRGFGTN